MQILFEFHQGKLSTPWFYTFPGTWLSVSITFWMLRAAVHSTILGVLCVV